jgi:hypothetical protein
MVIEKIKELEATRAKLAELESSVATELNSELAALPAAYGFTTVAAFLKAVKAASGRRGGRKAKVAPKSAPAGKRKRAKITDKTRDDVKKLVEEGKTGAEIAKSVGISLPSVQNIKKALGLVAKRK